MNMTGAPLVDFMTRHMKTYKMFCFVLFSNLFLVSRPDDSATTISPWNTTISQEAQDNGLLPGVTDYDYDYSGYYEVDLDSALAPCYYASHGSHVLLVIYSLFFIVGFLGNTLVVWVNLMGAQLKSMTDVCLLNLSIADLLLALSLPFLAHYAVDQWIFGNFMCTLVLGVYYVGFYGGIFFIVLMSIDRYLAIVHAVFALRDRTKAYGIIASIVIWGIAILVCFPELIYLDSYENNNDTLCSAYPPDNSSHNYYKSTSFFKMNVLGLLLPLAIVGFSYTMVLRRPLTLHSSKRQAMRLVLAVMVVFFLCWAPYNIMAFIKGLELRKIIRADCEASERIQASLQFTEVLAYFHSCLNPFLYAFVGEKFKRDLIRLLLRTPCIKLQFMKVYLTQATGSVYSQTTSVDERSAAV